MTQEPETEAGRALLATRHPRSDGTNHAEANYRWFLNSILAIEEQSEMRARADEAEHCNAHTAEAEAELRRSLVAKARAIHDSLCNCPADMSDPNCNAPAATGTIALIEGSDPASLEPPPNGATFDAMLADDQQDEASPEPPDEAIMAAGIARISSKAARAEVREYAKGIADTYAALAEAPVTGED